MTTTYQATPPGDLTLPTGRSALDDTYRAITWRLIPFLFVLWVLAWIDRVNIGFVKLTMLDDLKWSDAIYGLGAGIFFLGYFFFRGAVEPAAAANRRAQDDRAHHDGLGRRVRRDDVREDAGDVLLPALPDGGVRGRLLPRDHPVPHLLVPERAAREGVRHVHVGVGLSRA